MSPIKIHLRPVGAAPALSQAKFKLDGNKPLVEVQRFLQKKLASIGEEKEKERHSLFMYCGTGFSPTLDQSLDELFNCFATGDELIIVYGLQEAWG